jgi:hypothetical protein
MGDSVSDTLAPLASSTVLRSRAGLWELFSTDVSTLTVFMSGVQTKTPQGSM